jgi:hypothetical protein
MPDPFYSLIKFFEARASADCMLCLFFFYLLSYSA